MRLFRFLKIDALIDTNEKNGHFTAAEATSKRDDRFDAVWGGSSVTCTEVPKRC